MLLDGTQLLTCTSQIRVQPWHLFVSFRADTVDRCSCFTDNAEKKEKRNIIFQTFCLIKESKRMRLGKKKVAGQSVLYISMISTAFNFLLI